MGPELDDETQVSLLSIHSGAPNNNNNNNNNKEEEERRELLLEAAQSKVIQHKLKQLMTREGRLLAWRHAWASHRQQLWGPPPAYQSQPQDTASFIGGRLYYNWAGGLLSLAARGVLKENEMPRPTFHSRAAVAGMMLGGTLEAQHQRRHQWEAFIGCIVKHRRDKGGSISCGRLRWVGEVQQRREPGRLFAGVEWEIPPAHYKKQIKRNKGKSPFHDGCLEGERLFYTSGGNNNNNNNNTGMLGEANATCEYVEDIIIASPVDYLPHLQPELWNNKNKNKNKKVKRFYGMPITTLKPPEHMSTAKALFSALGGYIFMQIPARLLRDACQLSVPVILQYYIEYLQSEEPGWRDGLLLVMAFSILSLVQSTASSKVTHLSWHAGYVFQNALQAVIFEKCATISRKSLMHPEMSIGRIVNMVSSDVGTARGFPQMIPIVFEAPLQLAVSLVLLYRLVGWCAFAGFGVLIVFFPLQGFLMRKYYAVYSKLSKATDARLKATNEFFSGVRVAKFMSWEPSFVKSIEEKRKAELSELRSLQLLYIFISFITNTIPALVIAVVFLLYHTNGHELTPAIVFPTISLLEIMQTPFIMIPVALSSVLRFVVSMRRVTKFLECENADTALQDLQLYYKTKEKEEQEQQNEIFKEEKTEEKINDNKMEDIAVEFNHATISTFTPNKLPPCEKELKSSHRKRDENNNSDTTTPNNNNTSSPSEEYYELQRKELLHDITLHIPKRKLTCIIGDTGCGKSTLLESLLGCHEITSGTMRVISGKIAYVPQQAWIMNATLEENILFFTDKDHSRFNRALQCTQLKTDLHLLAGGIKAEIGEKGINLSGGQKARVSLARAVYAEREVYILDDPLSALDAHVGERVLRECILGVLKDKTRILATHQLHVLPYADYIVVLREGGAIAFKGNYEEYKEFEKNNNNNISTLQEENDNKNEGDNNEENNNEINKKNDEKNTNASNDNTNYDNNYNNNNNNNNNKDDNNNNMNDILDDDDNDNENDKNNKEIMENVNELNGKLMTEEEKATGAVSMEIYMKYAEACGGKGVCTTIFLIFILTEFVLVSPSLWLSFWSVRTFNITSQTYLLVYVGLVAASALSSPLRNTSAYAALRTGSLKLHGQLLRSVAVAPVSFFDTTPLGRVINRFSKDMNSIDNALPSSIIFFLQCILSVISSLLVMAISQYFVLLAILPCAAIYYKIMLFYNSANREMRRIANRANSPVFSILGEFLAGKWTISAYDKATSVMAEALERIDTVYACSYMQIVCNCWLSVRIELLSNVVTSSIALLGVLLVMLHFSNVNIGMLSLSLTMSMNMNSLLKYVVNQSAAVEAEMNSVERVLHYISNIEHEELIEDMDETIKEIKKNDKKQQKEKQKNYSNDTEAIIVPVMNINHNNNENNEDNTTDSLFSPSEVKAISIEFRNVTMRYRVGLPLVLRGVSFTIAPGEKVGIVGRTGSGKSSLLLTFLRIVDIESGDILISNKPIRSYPLRQLRQMFAMIPQDPLLFNGTLRDNLDPFHECSDEEIQRAIHLVGLQGRLSSNSNNNNTNNNNTNTNDIQLDSLIEEGGVNFSVGQRQLLCLTRALLRREACGCILIDEATASMDPRLDQHIQHTLRHTLGRHTIVAIAHRLPTIAAYDRVIVVEGGGVWEVGRPLELVRRRGSKLGEMVGALGAEAAQAFIQAAQRDHNEGRW